MQGLHVVNPSGPPIKTPKAVPTALWQGTVVGLIVGILFAIDIARESFLRL
ncbi:MAG: hypothetical protein ACJ8BW_25030 [Ktedonobacteraceae bacterium]